MNTQTPGPLTYREDFSGVYAFTKDGPQDGKAHAMIADTSEGEIWNGAPLPIDEREANGKLIAAAYSAFDETGRELGIDATLLATTLNLTQLIYRAQALLDSTDDRATLMLRTALRNTLDRIKPQ